MSGATLGWDWAHRCRVVGGMPTVELWDEAIAAGDGAVPLMVGLLAQRDLRTGEPPDARMLPVAAMRVLATLRAEGGIPALVGVLLDPVDPSEYSEDAALALGRVGAPALGPVEGILRDSSRRTWERASAGHAMVNAALVDRRLRARVRAAYERVLLDPRETDRTFNANLALDAVTLGMLVLQPAIEVCHAAGRLDEDMVTMDAVRLDLAIRHHRPDIDAKVAARRDFRQELRTWAEMCDALEPEDLRRFERAMARARERTSEHIEDDLGELYEG